ncbi:MAG: hypothetical protein AAF901_13715, partial [Bacteroidota bacterium]
MNPKILILLLLFWKLYFPGYGQTARSPYETKPVSTKEEVELVVANQWKEEKIASSVKHVSLRGKPKIRVVNTNVLPILERQSVVIPPSS